MNNQLSLSTQLSNKKELTCLGMVVGEVVPVEKLQGALRYNSRCRAILQCGHEFVNVFCWPGGKAGHVAEPLSSTLKRFIGPFGSVSRELSTKELLQINPGNENNLDHQVLMDTSLLASISPPEPKLSVVVVIFAVSKLSEEIFMVFKSAGIKIQKIDDYSAERYGGIKHYENYHQRYYCFANEFGIDRIGNTWDPAAFFQQLTMLRMYCDHPLLIEKYLSIETISRSHLLQVLKDHLASNQQIRVALQEEGILFVQLDGSCSLQQRQLALDNLPLKLKQWIELIDWVKSALLKSFDITQKIALKSTLWSDSSKEYAHLAVGFASCHLAHWPPKSPIRLNPQPEGIALFGGGIGLCVEMPQLNLLTLMSKASARASEKQTHRKISRIVSGSSVVLPHQRDAKLRSLESFVKTCMGLQPFDGNNKLPNSPTAAEITQWESWSAIRKEAMIKRINMVAINNPNANEQHLKYLQNEQLSKLKRLIKGVSFESKNLPSNSPLSKRVKVTFESNLAKAGITRFTFDWSATPESECSWNAVIIDVLLPNWLQWARGSKLHVADEDLPGIRQRFLNWIHTQGILRTRSENQSPAGNDEKKKRALLRSRKRKVSFSSLEELIAFVVFLKAFPTQSVIGYHLRDADCVSDFEDIGIDQHPRRIKATWRSKAFESLITSIDQIALSMPLNSKKKNSVKSSLLRSAFREPTAFEIENIQVPQKFPRDAFHEQYLNNIGLVAQKSFVSDAGFGNVAFQILQMTPGRANAQVSRQENVQVQGNASVSGPSVIQSFNKSIPGSFETRKQGGVSMGPMDITPRQPSSSQNYSKRFCLDQSDATQLGNVSGDDDNKMK
ncbi:hypothetical protein PPACK8108_LOCUS19348 [Phakopsora pachyrhizi]|uniref:Uncharacterized protein n=1 Tax=Phakopsora pachyrhizi TaxID=170000 RepID=A0AAV0BCJ6_PHAPC|nr:hypothetical protein PPACK8108_LOCUS19348 [Phakopsora pachyrhizi]